MKYLWPTWRRNEHGCVFTGLFPNSLNKWKRQDWVIEENKMSRPWEVTQESVAAETVKNFSSPKSYLNCFFFSSRQFLSLHCSKMFFVAKEDTLLRVGELNNICTNVFQGSRLHQQSYRNSLPQNLPNFLLGLLSSFLKIGGVYKTPNLQAPKKMSWKE